MSTLFDLGLPADPLAGLNDAQRRAVTHADDPLLVIAGAGTERPKSSPSASAISLPPTPISPANPSSPSPSPKKPPPK